jgi:hypothetical protein
MEDLMKHASKGKGRGEEVSVTMNAFATFLLFACWW